MSANGTPNADRPPAKITLEAPGEEPQVGWLEPGRYVILCSPERYVVSEEVDEATGEALVMVGVRGVTDA